MSKVYLVSRDGYLESIMGSRAAVDAEGVAQIIASHRMEYFMEHIRNVQVDFETGIVQFECKPEWEEDWEQEGAMIIPFEIVENNLPS